MRGPVSFTVLLSLALGYTTLHAGGRWDWMNFSLLGVGLVGVGYWLFTSRDDFAPPLESNIRWPLLMLPCYVALQVTPLPVAALRAISPSHRELLHALSVVAPGIRFAPISVEPPATLAHLIRFCAYVIVFLAVRELTWRLDGRAWAVAWPLIMVGCVEAIVGLLQTDLRLKSSRIMGSFENSDHFAGYLAMSLPFAVIYPIASLQREFGKRKAVLAAMRYAALAAAWLIALGLLLSLSRMGFVASVVSLTVIGAMRAWRTGWFVRSGKRKSAVAAVALALAVAIMAPGQLVLRFGEIGHEDIRLPVWRSTLDLIAAYPVFGCGLGTYRSAFMKFKPTPLRELTHAHNDYLQFAAELGVLGFTLGAWLMGAISLRALRVTWRNEDRGLQLLGLACVGAIVAILIHSLADFNLYIHANGLLFAWILGIAGGLPYSADRTGRMPS